MNFITVPVLSEMDLAVLSWFQKVSNGTRYDDP
jgi:hypothetical protein